MRKGTRMYDLVEVLWGGQLAVVRLVLFAQIALVLIHAARFVQSVRRLYGFTGDVILAEDILKGEADPDQLAALALGNGLTRKAILEYRTNSERSKGIAAGNNGPRVLRAAEGRFLYLWGTCYADMEAAKRASVFSFLLTLVLIAYATLPTFERHITDKAAYPLQAVAHLLSVLTFGWSCCTVLYLISSLLARKLAERKTCWRYFCSILRNEMSRE